MKRFLMVAAIAAMPVLAGGLGTKTAVVANGQSLSGVVDLAGNTPVVLHMPAWTAADVTFQACTSSATTSCSDLYDEFGGELVVTVGALAAPRSVIVTPSDYAGVRYLRIRSGKSGAAVAQGAERTITISVRGN